MILSDIPILSMIVFTPLAGSLIVMFCRRREWIQYVSLATAVVSFGLTLIPVFAFRSDLGGFQLEEYLVWIKGFGISYHLGVDGLSLFLLPLTGFLTVAAVLVSWNHVGKKEKLYYITFLILETGMLGVFVSLDTFLFYVFWEAMLIPMFLIIGIWGSKNRWYAAIKFLIYTIAGSVFMLAAVIVIAVINQKATGSVSFDLTDWLALEISSKAQIWLFIAFFVAFAIKVPVVPFHTWLPDAHVEAPTAGSVLLAGILLKMGIYGMLRFCYPLFPAAVIVFTPWIIILGLVGVIYGAFLAFAQRDVKRLIAYSSISHMGLIVVGIFALNLTGIKGGIIQMVNHGLSTGALFILAGAIYERKGTRDLDKLGGLAGKVPVMATFFMIIVLSSIGLPGMNGFVGELLLLLGALRYSWWAGALGATTVVFSAIYMLWMYQRIMFETERSPTDESVSDFSLREKLVMTSIVLFVFVIGLYPAFFLKRMNSTAGRILSALQKPAAPYAMILQTDAGEKDNVFQHPGR
jgi:NADH-quinone oxidoreductase subunit M